MDKLQKSTEQAEQPPCVFAAREFIRNWIFARFLHISRIAKHSLHGHLPAFI